MFSFPAGELEEDVLEVGAFEAHLVEHDAAGRGRLADLLGGGPGDRQLAGAVEGDPGAPGDQEVAQRVGLRGPDPHRPVGPGGQGGQRQAVAVARAAAFGSKVVVLDEPTAALGVRESNQVLELIRNLRDRGIPVILISHNMPHVFDVADRIHIQRLGKRAATITPESHSMTDAVAIMTGAARA